MLERMRPLVIKDVPAWFVDWIPLGAPTGDALIMSGWQQAGKIVVGSHPGHAYAELWHNCSGILVWFAAAYLAGLIFLLMLLRFLLNPIRTVEKMALDISRREFPVMEKLPWSRELKRVVTAMNQMSRRLKANFKEQTVFIESLRNRAHRDPVTGIANRDAFKSRLQHLLQSPEEFSTGALYLVHIDNFQTFNQSHGHTAGDQLLMQAARYLDEECRRIGEAYLLARLTGAQFGIFCESLQDNGVDDFAAALVEGLLRVNRKADRASSLVVHCGATLFTAGESFGGVMARSDTALRAAKDRDGSNWHCVGKVSPFKGTAFPADGLRKILRQRLEKGEIALAMMPVLALPEMKNLHNEALVRIADDQNGVVPARLFIHLAEQMGRIVDLDRLVIEAVLAILNDKPESPERYAINLSTQSLKQPDFLNWLDDTLQRSPECSQRLAFECREFDITEEMAELKAPLDQIAASGAMIGIDRFGTSGHPFSYLSNLKPAYLKVDGSYLNSISTNMENQFFLRSVATIAHGLEIQVVATHVENEEKTLLLHQLGVDAVQGRNLNC